MVLDDASPYPWPWDGDLDGAGTAVVVAGAQHAWAQASASTDEVTAAIAAVTSAVRAGGGLVVLLRHAMAPRSASARPVALPPVAGTPGWGLLLEPGPDDVVVDCWGVDGFTGSNLDVTLRSRGIARLVLTGFGAEAAVDSTLRRANDMGYECLTLTDAVAPFDPDLGRHALASVTMSGGIFGAIAPSAALLAALHLTPLLEVPS